MKKKNMQHSRRQFLWGAGGAMVCIPFLPSLLSKAQAAAAPYSPSRSFFAFATDHGGVWGKNQFPDASLLTNETSYAGRLVRHGALPTSETGLSFSNVYRAPLADASLASKFNVYRGLDIPWRIGHHRGGHLGNFAENVGSVIGGTDARKSKSPTLDQTIAWSANFYNQHDLDARMTQRSFNVADGSMSWNHTSPATRSGEVVRQPSFNRNLALFDYLFRPGTSYNGVDTFLVDRIKQSYARLRRHRRLSYGDRARLDQHVERMFEVERKLRVIDQLENVPAVPLDDSSDISSAGNFRQSAQANGQYAGLMNDIITLAFSAGVSRVGTWFQSMKFVDELINDWHGEVAHQGFGAEVAQDYAVTWNRGTFSIMADLATKMNNTDAGDGTTLLDNSLLMFTSEAGQLTHHTNVMTFPVVCAGSAGGYFNTGRYVDFANRETPFDDLAQSVADNDMLDLEAPGLYYNQFLGNVAQAMGVDPSEYENFKDFRSGQNVRGFGVHHVDSEREEHYALARNAMGEALPVATNG